MFDHPDTGFSASSSGRLFLDSGTISGRVRVDESNAVFTMNDGMIDGGTITNNGTGHALSAYGVETLEGTVFRTKNADICVSFGEDGYRIGPWKPDGYTAAETPDAEGYYYLTKERHGRSSIPK